MELDGFKGWCSKNHAFALKEKFNIVSRTRTLYISLHAQSPGLHTIPQTRSPILLFLDYTPPQSLKPDSHPYPDNSAPKPQSHSDNKSPVHSTAYQGNTVH